MQPSYVSWTSFPCHRGFKCTHISVHHHFSFFQWLFDKLSVAELKVTLAPVAGLFILNASCPTLISYEFNIKNCGFLSHTCACPACWSSLDDTQTVNESRRAPWEPLTRVTCRPRIYLELHYRGAHRTTGQKCSHRSGGAEKSPDAHLSVGEMLLRSRQGDVGVMQKARFKSEFQLYYCRYLLSHCVW